MANSTGLGDHPLVNGLVTREGLTEPHNFANVETASSDVLLDYFFGDQGGGGFSDAAFSMAGVGTLVAVGESSVEAVFSLDGTATASFVGASDVGGFTDTEFSIAGAGDALIVGAATADSVAFAAGAGVLVADGAASAAAVFSMAGVGALDAVGFADTFFDTVFLISGIGAVTAAATAEAGAVFSIIGEGNIIAVGAFTGDAPIDIPADSDVLLGGGGNYDLPQPTVRKPKKLKTWRIGEFASVDISDIQAERDLKALVSAAKIQSDPDRLKAALTKRKAMLAELKKIKT